MIELSNKNKVDCLTLPIEEVVANLKEVVAIFESETLKNLQSYNLKEMDVLKNTKDEKYHREIMYYLSIRAAIYHLESIYKNPASFI